MGRRNKRSYQSSGYGEAGQRSAAPVSRNLGDNWRRRPQQASPSSNAAYSPPQRQSPGQHAESSRRRSDNYRPESLPASSSQGRGDYYRPVYRSDSSEADAIWRKDSYTSSVAAAPPTPPATPSPTRNGGLTAPLSLQEECVGRIMFLPRRLNGQPCPKYSRVLQTQSHVNDKAGGHFALVWDVYERPEDGVAIVRCLPMTSFGELVEDKYKTSKGQNAWRSIVRYLPIDHHAQTTSRLNMPVLRLQGGRSMRVQSYVHLDHFYEVEWAMLDGRNTVGLRLEAHSVSIALGKFSDYLDGKIYHPPVYPHIKAVSPLAPGKYGPPRNVSKEVKERIGKGRVLEQERLNATGTLYVSGKEDLKPEDIDPEASRWEPFSREQTNADDASDAADAAD